MKKKQLLSINIKIYFQFQSIILYKGGGRRVGKAGEKEGGTKRNREEGKGREEMEKQEKGGKGAKRRRGVKRTIKKIGYEKKNWFCSFEGAVC